MKKTPLSSGRLRAFRLLLLPLICLGIFSLVVLTLKGFHAGYSALLGGMVWAVPNAYFVHRVFKVAPAKKMVAGFYRAEMTKLALSAVLFVAILKFISVAAIFVLVAYFIAQFAFWIELMFYFGLSA